MSTFSRYATILTVGFATTLAVQPLLVGAEAISATSTSDSATVTGLFGGRYTVTKSGQSVVVRLQEKNPFSVISAVEMRHMKVPEVLTPRPEVLTPR